MPELDDHSTDKLFQTGADRHDFAYNPDAWREMEGMLDADAQSGQRKRWLLGLFLLSSLVIAAVFYLWMYNQSVITNPLTSVNGDVATTSTDVSATAPNGSGNLTAELDINSDANQVGTTAPSVVTAAKNKSTTDIVERQLAGEDSGIFTSASLPSLTEEVSVGDEAVGVGKVTPELYQRNNLSNSNDFDRQKTPVLRIPARFITAVSSEILTTENSIDVQTAVPELQDAGPQQSLAVSVGAGLILGMIDKGEELKTTPRYVADLEYRIGPHIAIGTGLAFNRITYRSPGQAYDPKGERWVRDVEPVFVDAHCEILEIPLSIKYFLKGSRSNTFYGSVGTINYLLLKENYDFTYNEVANDLKMSWEGRNANTHLFGVGHVNLGFQRKLRGQSSIRVESFVHVPLTGIGQGQTNLFNAGVTLNYTFDFLKKR